MSRNANQSERTGRGKAGLLIVYGVFADTQRRGCARGTQAGPRERFIKAGRQCPSQAVVLDAPLKVSLAASCFIILIPLSTIVFSRRRAIHGVESR
jgi:hypothetical protein